VKAAVRNKLGVGLLFRGSVQNNIKRGEFKAIKLPADAVEGTYFIVYHKTRLLSPLAQDFLTLLRQRQHRSVKSQGFSGFPVGKMVKRVSTTKARRTRSLKSRLSEPFVAFVCFVV